LNNFRPDRRITYFAAGSVVTESFTGVLLWDLLNNPPVNGIVTNPNIKNDILHKVIIVTGTDVINPYLAPARSIPFLAEAKSWWHTKPADNRSVVMVSRGSLFREIKPVAGLSQTSQT
jgi:hypothetical protein